MINELGYEDFYIARKIKNRMLKGVKKWSSRKTRNNIVPLVNAEISIENHECIPKEKKCQARRNL